ncbi:hypothetical protein LPJ78_004413 [Coemansia sp. RSA 989]|nr:hypothetical protein LPJ78_004413 [Coemansia sp. RSA 989]
MNSPTKDKQEPLSSTALLNSATQAMSLLAQPASTDYKHTTSAYQPLSSLALASSAPATAAAVAAAAASLGAYSQLGGMTSDKRALTKSPVPASGKLTAVKSGGIHKSKASTSSVSSTSTVGSSRAGGHRRGASTASDRMDEHSERGQSVGRDMDGEMTPEQQRRQRFLERNRIAASKCRQKKKLWVQELERRAEDVTMQNRTLHIAVAQLKEEVMVLKNQLLAHRNCNCSAIHQYLQAECAAPDASVVASDVPLATQPQHSLMSPPQHPAMAAAVAAAASTGPPLLLQHPPAPAPPMVMQSQQFRSSSMYASHVPHHQHASSVDLASIGHAGSSMPAPMIPSSASATANVPTSTSPRP